MDQQQPTTDNAQNIVGENIDLGLTRLADKLQGAVGLKLEAVTNNAIDQEAIRLGLTAPIGGTLGEKTYEQSQKKPCSICSIGAPAILAIIAIVFLVLR